jgi:hypothetical protein
MKNNYLLTFGALLALTSSGVLLTEVSSSAQSTQTGQKSSLSSKKSTEQKAKEANPQPSEAPSIIPDNPTPSATSSTNNAVNGASAKGSAEDVSPLPLILGGLSGLLHLIEIAGMVWAYLKINQLSEKSRDSRSQIKSLTDKLSAAEKNQKIQGDQLKSIGAEAANARNLAAKMNVIGQASSQQKYGGNADYANPGYSLPSPEAANAAPTKSEYPFLDTYRQSSDNFKNKYAPKVVSEDADNLQKRRSGDYQEIILGEDRQGNYWLFNDGSTTYLVPSPKLKVNDLNIRTAGGLFTCENYTPGYQHVNVVRPAIISIQQGVNERWKLEKKGILEFT